MVLLKETIGTNGEKEHLYYCPGCRCSHYLDKRWSISFNGNLPTVSPSIHVNPNYPEERCHHFIREGRIEYLNDSYHELRGKSVLMQDYDNIR